MSRITAKWNLSAMSVGILLLAACDGKDSEADTDAAVQDGPMSDGGMDADMGDKGDASDETACDTTWAALQKTVIEGRGCTASACHDGDDPEGMLDLTQGAAYDAMINVQSQADLDMPLITPGDEKLSLLYLKLEAGTMGTELPAGAGSPMPVSGAPLSTGELGALRLWIRAGAPKQTVVDGTQDLLDCKLPDTAEPNKIVPPPVPDEDEGFQHYSGPWTVEPNSENEVCYGTYYDLSDSAPDWAKVDCTVGGREQTCVAIRKRQLSQDSQSHHSIISVYAGEASTDDPGWGEWTCGGGEMAGTACDPTQPNVSAADGGGDCGERAICQTSIRDGIGCTGLGPNDSDTASVSVGGAQTPVSTADFPEGVYAVVPIEGVVLWNSHGFNLTEYETTIEQYNNFWYAERDDQLYRMEGIFDIRYIFTMQVPPFEEREYCATYTLPRYARVSNLNSHRHKRGVLWRTWLPPNEPCTPETCEPNEEDPVYVSRVYNDPVYLDFAPALIFDQEDDAERTLKYCAVFDNGAEDPSTVKRESGLPEGASNCTGIACVGGPDEGKACVSNSDCGGDGVCDACTLRGGFTTEDEMMILQGRYHVQPPAE